MNEREPKPRIGILERTVEDKGKQSETEVLTIGSRHYPYDLLPFIAHLYRAGPDRVLYQLEWETTSDRAAAVTAICNLDANFEVLAFAFSEQDDQLARAYDYVPGELSEDFESIVLSTDDFTFTWALRSDAPLFAHGVLSSSDPRMLLDDTIIEAVDMTVEHRMLQGIVRHVLEDFSGLLKQEMGLE